MAFRREFWPISSQPLAGVPLSQEMAWLCHDVYVPAHRELSPINGPSYKYSKTDSPVLSLVGGEVAESFPSSSAYLRQGATSTYSFLASTSKAIFIRVYPRALSATYIYAIGNAVMALALRHTSISNNWGFYDGTSVLSAGETLPTVNKYYNLLACHDYVNGACKCRLYRDGRLTATVSATNNYWGANALDVNSFGNGTLGSDLAIAMFSRFDSYVPHDFAVRLTRDPYATAFEPLRIDIKSAAASLPTLSSATYMPGSITSSGFRPRVTAS